MGLHRSAAAALPGPLTWQRCSPRFTWLYFCPAACVEITGVAGFEEVARAAPPSLFAESAQAAFLAYFSTVNKVCQGCSAEAGLQIVSPGHYVTTAAFHQLYPKPNSVPAVQTAATACPRSQADGKVRLGAVTVDAMWVCRKVKPAASCINLVPMHMAFCRA